MSQAELGRSAKVGRNYYISEIELGISNPSVETMVLVAEALGCKISDLLQPDASGFVAIRADDMRRAQEALAVLQSILTTRKRARRVS